MTNTIKRLRVSGPARLAPCCGLLLVVALGRPVDAADPSAESLAAFLSMKEIAAADRAPLAAPGPWTDDKERVLVRVLARLAAPEPLASRWRSDAARLPPRGEATPIDDQLVTLVGRATFVAPRVLPAELSQGVGRPGYDVVRLTDERGAVVDVALGSAPKAWPRWQPIDEPVEVTGLPLATASGPVPAGGSGAAWPAAPADLLVAASAVRWRPATPLGRLGGDYALFDTILDDRRLEPGDTAAFWSVMAAAAGGSPAAIGRDAGGPTDVLGLIDPARKWFATHRGDPVVIDGVARRATRIAIDDPGRRASIGADHYWEVEVFADTPTIKVHDRVQDRYPIVCCVVTLPAGMPTGDAISERVRVPGFGFKRYSYPLRDVLVSSAQGDAAIEGERMSTALIIAPTVEWRRPPSPAGVSNLLFAVFAGIIGLAAAALAASAWSSRSDARQAERRRRESLPDRIDLPND